MVLPEPTSPWSRRFIGESCASSSARVLPTAAWPAVRVNGSCRSKAASSPSARPAGGGLLGGELGAAPGEGGLEHQGFLVAETVPGALPVRGGLRGVDDR